jgi:hypothetical protein
LELKEPALDEPSANRRIRPAPINRYASTTALEALVVAGTYSSIDARLFGPIMRRKRNRPDLDAILALPEHGRGLTIARAALDSLEYDRTTSGENHWKLTKQA